MGEDNFQKEYLWFSDGDGDGYRDNADVRVPATRAYGGERGVRREDQTESARVGDARHDSGDVRVPPAHEHVGVRVAR